MRNFVYLISISFLVNACNYQNPILNVDFPDPTALYASDGNIYVYATTGNGFRYQVAMSTDGCNFVHKGEAMPNPPSWGYKDFWAPDVTEHNGTFWMYYSAESNQGGKCIGSAISSSPLGPFKDTGAPIICGSDFINIDAKMFDDPKPSTCSYDGVIHDLAGADLAPPYDCTGNNDDEKDACCCNYCSSNPDCYFWVRSTDNTSCWIKTNFTGYTEASNRRGNFKSSSIYLYWRSDFQPLGVQEIDSSRIKFKSSSTPVNTVYVDNNMDYQQLIEGSWLQYNPTTNYYYLYFSGNNCCGTDRHYAVLVARSRYAKGPFQTLANFYGSKSSAIVEANSAWDAPGHNSILVDKQGQEWVFYHAYHQGDQNSRVLLMDKITYNNDQWPQAPGAPSSSSQPGPVI